MEHLYMILKQRKEVQRNVGQHVGQPSSLRPKELPPRIQELRRRPHTHTVRGTGRLSFETSFQSNWHHPVPLNLNISGQRHSGTSSLVSYFNKRKSILLLFFETVLKIRRGDGGTLAWKRNWWTKQARTSQDAWSRCDLLQVFFQSLQQFYIWIALFLCLSLTLKALHQETIIHENIDP